MNEEMMNFGNMDQMMNSSAASGVLDQYAPYIEIANQTSQVFNIFTLVTFLLIWWGLYNINKKLWNEHAWISFIPVVQYYSFFEAGWLSFKKYFVYPLLFIILWAIGAIFTLWISLLVALIYYLYCWVKNLNSISKKTWRWTWTTLGLLFFPYIMFPIVWYKFERKEERVSNV